MLRCREFTGMLTAYRDGALSLADRLAMGLHRALCPHCRRYLDQLGRTLAALGRLEAPPPSPERRAALLTLLRARKPSGGD